jgi:hypothetical protein
MEDLPRVEDGVALRFFLDEQKARESKKEELGSKKLSNREQGAIKSKK